MKTTVSHHGGYAVHVQVTPVAYPEGHKHVVISTTYDDARNPAEHRTVLSMSFSPEELAAFRETLK